MLKKFGSLALTLTLAGFGTVIASTASAQTTPIIDSPGPVGGPVNPEDVISNNNLRTMTGSSSKWSFASQWNYLGGTVREPFDQSRPNIAASSATTAKTDIDASLNVKYNLSKKDSLFAGFGVRWVAPFKAGGPTNYSGSTYDAVNPTITYQHIYKYFGVQAVTQVSAMQYTQADSVANGYAQSLSADQENIYEFGKSGFSLGASTGLSTNRFTNSDAVNLDQQSTFTAWVLPYAEYQINDKINLRTVWNLWQYEHYRNETWVHDTVTTSVGVGFQVSSNVFFYPNIQFLPSNTSSDLTNVGLSATINLF